MTLNIKESKGPCKTYKAMRAASLNHLTHALHYPDQTKIPNIFKVIEEPRRMVILHIAKIGQFPIEERIGHKIQSDIYIHVAQGVGEIYYKHQDGRQGFRPIERERSYKITRVDAEATLFAIRLNEEAVIAFDITESLPDEPIFVQERRIEEFEYTPPASIRNYTYSFLRREMTLEEIRDRIIFVDSEGAQGQDKHVIPISIAVMNYQGRMLMQEVICPRKFIRSYQTHIHGLDETWVLGQRDEKKVMKEFQELVKGRIIVGHDLRMEQTSLKINVRHIAGVRDIQSSIAACKVMRCVRDQARNISLK